jgi:phosphoribosyl 1,2-cyclic phosphodiesterase
MILHILGSSSKGNCYIFESGGGEALILEAGVHIKEVKQALNFNISRVVGCLLSHEHGDHSKYAGEMVKAGIDLYGSGGTLGKFDSISTHRLKVMAQGLVYKIGSFKVMGFLVEHDAAEPFGFLLYHKEMGQTLFLTDSFFSAYTFKGLSNIIVEANYSQEILDAKLSSGKVHGFVRNRVLQSHMSLDTI